ncbi:MAG: ABC transporter substrate-binding protein [Chloroflexota bacterium]|nr:ABC transporter substrate-binding protein [Chloroflexota bacterium]MDE2908507.1 ABC transporter substrate-binding protein [Chloroflexota bacterium]
MTKSNEAPANELSRREFLNVFAAGAAAAVGTVSLSGLSGIANAQGGALRFAWLTPATLDPRSASGDSEIAILNAVYDYLIETDAAANLVPRLAASWDVSDDGLVYTLQLREDAAWHDGSPVTADDVVWTINWQIESEGSVASLLSTVESVSALGERAIEISLSAPNPDFLYNLTDNKLVILKAGAENIGVEFNGSGPFVFEEMIAGDRAILRANADYWGGAPSIDRLEFIYFSDQQAGIAALQGGSVDGIARLDNSSFLGFSGDVNFNTTDIATSGHHLARLRADREPGSDVRVRQAFKLATDRDAIWERVQLGFGAVGKDSPIGPAFGQYFLADAEVPARDPAAAAALLAEAGYPDGLDMTLHLPNSGNFPDLAQTLAAQWEEAGIRVEVRLEEENVYWNELWMDVDLGITGWGPRPVPQLYLDFAYHSEGVWNESHYSNERVDELIEIGRSSLDQAKRTAAYKEIQQILLDEGPIIVPYFFAAFMVLAGNISGLNLHPFAGRTNFNTAELG